MTVAGLPGIPGKAALVPALDMFIADVLDQTGGHIAEGGEAQEVCGAFIYRHLEPEISISESGICEVHWLGEFDWVRMENISPDPEHGFMIDSGELQSHLEAEIANLKYLAQRYGRDDGVSPTQVEVFASGFSPLVGLGHSHPAGSADVSGADHAMCEGSSQWRRAAAPQTVLGKPQDAKFYEAHFLFAIHDLKAREGTLVHFRRGAKQAEWRGNFTP